MNRNHSPGLWRWCNASGGLCQCGLIWCISGDYWVGSASKTNEGTASIPDPEFQANKRLMSAAPDLLHVVDELLAAFRKGIRSLDDTEEEALFKLAEAAVARATDTTPVPDEEATLELMAPKGAKEGLRA